MEEERFPLANAAKEETKRNNQDVANGTKVLVTLRDELRDVFSATKNNLNLVHVNCQSITAHYMRLLHTFTCSTIDAIFISETFLKDSIEDKDVGLPGFKLIRNDRYGKRGGGVAIYLRESINFIVVDRSPNEYSKSSEYLFIEISNKDTKVLMGVFYCPSSRINYFERFGGLLKRHRYKYQHFICLGDFNTDLLKSNGRANKLISLVDGHILFILQLPNNEIPTLLPYIQPTYFGPNSTPSLLDLTIVSNPCHVDKEGQLTGCFSHHDILYLSYRLDFKNDVPTTSSASSEYNIQQLLQSTPVRKALALQLISKKNYKMSLTDNSEKSVEYFKEYQKCCENVKILENEFNRTKKQCQLL